MINVREPTRRDIHPRKVLPPTQLCICQLASNESYSHRCRAMRPYFLRMERFQAPRVETMKIQLGHTDLSYDRPTRLAEARCSDERSSRSSKSWRRSWNTEQREIPRGHLVNAFLATMRKRSIALDALAYGLNPIGISSEQKAPATCEKVTVGEIGDPERRPWNLENLRGSWVPEN